MTTDLDAGVRAVHSVNARGWRRAALGFVAGSGWLTAFAILCGSAGVCFAQLDATRGGEVPPSAFFDRYTLHSASKENLSFVADPAGGTRRVIRLTLDANDPKVAGGSRSEIIPLKEYVREGVRWYAMSMFLPKDWIPHPYPTLIAQLHTTQRTAVLSPPVALVVTDDRLNLVLRSSTRPVEGPDALTKQMADLRVVPLGIIRTGEWMCFIIRANWSWRERQGDLDIWLNRDRVYSMHDSPSAYETWLGNYPKIGLYAPGAMGVAHREIFVDYVWVGGAGSDFDELFRKTPCAR